MADEQEARDRRKRIDRLKKIIIGTIITAIVLPLLTSILFICLYVHSINELKDVRQQYDDLLSSMEQLKDSVSYESTEQDVYSTSDVEVSNRQTEAEKETAAEEDEYDKEVSMRKVYLTFDDGPSSSTDEILDILDEYGVKATFFVVGKTDDVSVAAYRRIVEDGHTLGMHSYSHKYSQIYASDKAFAEDLNKLQEYLYDVTGVWSRYYRFPGGSSNTASTVDMDQLITYLDEQDITYFDWNIVSGDASGKAVSADTIVQNCTSKLEDYSTAIILMHDASGKKTTVEALPEIIEAIQGMDNTEILPIDDNTIPIQHRKVD